MGGIPLNKESFDPSKIKITDLRTAVVASNFDYPLIRIDTNEGIYGLGEVRDAGHREAALLYKGLILGRNPLNVDELFRIMRPFAGHGREGGGISGIEMALWDIVGKVYGIPVYQLLGGKYRDRILIYGDTPSPREPTPEAFAEKVLERKRIGLRFVKFDMGIGILRGIPGALIGNHITDKGVAYMVSCVRAIREAVGWELPLAIDHFGPLSVKDLIRLGRALEEFGIAWMEDPRPWWDVEGNRMVTKAIAVPTATGEDIFGLSGFREIIDRRAVDIVHPDLATAGGIRETKRIADYAEERSCMPCALHFAGSPISFMANVHAAASIHNFVALEHHALAIPWWKDLVKGLPDPLLEDGYVRVPHKPGLGIDLNEETIREHLRYPGYFEPTPEWDRPKLGFYRP
ncbi:mandelate racemase/muconate lactonizing enzyme family protein [Candidatus Bathyarchaeota archaeon]|nr:mandelate racemase/muconate lactonizing enzyme family protein [Candidatus Bathyarchaeota archaeon]